MSAKLIEYTKHAENHFRKKFKNPFSSYSKRLIIPYFSVLTHPLRRYNVNKIKQNKIIFYYLYK